MHSQWNGQTSQYTTPSQAQGYPSQSLSYVNPQQYQVQQQQSQQNLQLQYQNVTQQQYTAAFQQQQQLLSQQGALQPGQGMVIQYEQQQYPPQQQLQVSSAAAEYQYSDPYGNTTTYQQNPYGQHTVTIQQQQGPSNLLYQQQTLQKGKQNNSNLQWVKPGNLNTNPSGVQNNNSFNTNQVQQQLQHEQQNLLSVGVHNSAPHDASKKTESSSSSSVISRININDIRQELEENQHQIQKVTESESLGLNSKSSSSSSAISRMPQYNVENEDEYISSRDGINSKIKDDHFRKSSKKNSSRRSRSRISNSEICRNSSGRKSQKILLLEKSQINFQQNHKHQSSLSKDMQSSQAKKRLSDKIGETLLGRLNHMSYNHMKEDNHHKKNVNNKKKVSQKLTMKKQNNHKKSKNRKTPPSRFKDSNIMDENIRHSMSSYQYQSSKSKSKQKKLQKYSRSADSSESDSSNLLSNSDSDSPDLNNNSKIKNSNKRGINQEIQNIINQNENDQGQKKFLSPISQSPGVQNNTMDAKKDQMRARLLAMRAGKNNIEKNTNQAIINNSSVGTFEIQQENQTKEDPNQNVQQQEKPKAPKSSKEIKLEKLAALKKLKKQKQQQQLQDAKLNLNIDQKDLVPQQTVSLLQQKMLDAKLDLAPSLPNTVIDKQLFTPNCIKSEINQFDGIFGNLKNDNNKLLLANNDSMMKKTAANKLVKKIDNIEKNVTDTQVSPTNIATKNQNAIPVIPSKLTSNNRFNYNSNSWVNPNVSQSGKGLNFPDKIKSHHKITTQSSNHQQQIQQQNQQQQQSQHPNARYVNPLINQPYCSIQVNAEYQPTMNEIQNIISKILVPNYYGRFDPKIDIHNACPWIDVQNGSEITRITIITIPNVGVTFGQQQINLKNKTSCTSGKVLSEKEIQYFDQNFLKLNEEIIQEMGDKKQQQDSEKCYVMPFLANKFLNLRGKNNLKTETRACLALKRGWYPSRNELLKEVLVAKLRVFQQLQHSQFQSNHNKKSLEQQLMKFKDQGVPKRDTKDMMQNIHHLLATRDELCLAGYPILNQQNLIGFENHLNDITFRTAIRDSEKEEGLKNDNLSVDNQNFLTSNPFDSLTPNFDDIIIIDCEMVSTNVDPNALARLSCVNTSGEILIDMYCKPNQPITDYKTKFSGITASHLKNIGNTVKDAQNALLKYLKPTTILCGHSLENDLKSLKIFHPFIIDTAILFPANLGLPMKRAMQKIGRELIPDADRILDRDHGHCSVKDSKMTWMLIKKRLEMLTTSEYQHPFNKEKMEKMNIFNIIKNKKNETQETALKKFEIMRGWGGLPNVTTTIYSDPGSKDSLSHGYPTQFNLNPLYSINWAYQYQYIESEKNSKENLTNIYSQQQLQQQNCEVNIADDCANLSTIEIDSEIDIDQPLCKKRKLCNEESCQNTEDQVIPNLIQTENIIQNQIVSNLNLNAIQAAAVSSSDSDSHLTADQLTARLSNDIQSGMLTSFNKIQTDVNAIALPSPSEDEKDGQDLIEVSPASQSQYINGDFSQQLKSPNPQMAYIESEQNGQSKSIAGVSEIESVSLQQGQQSKEKGLSKSIISELPKYIDHDKQILSKLKEVTQQQTNSINNTLKSQIEELKEQQSKSDNILTQKSFTNFKTKKHLRIINLNRLERESLMSGDVEKFQERTQPSGDSEIILLNKIDQDLKDIIQSSNKDDEQLQPPPFINIQSVKTQKTGISEVEKNAEENQIAYQNIKIIQKPGSELFIIIGSGYTKLYNKVINNYSKLIYTLENSHVDNATAQKYRTKFSNLLAQCDNTGFLGLYLQKPEAEKKQEQTKIENFQIKILKPQKSEDPLPSIPEHLKVQPQKEDPGPSIPPLPSQPPSSSDVTV